MTKLKGTKKIKRILKNFLAENGFGNFAIEIAPDFAYYHSYDTTEEMHKICFSVIVPSDNGFLENLYRRYKPEFVCDVALISFFHELGHHVTYDFFTMWTFTRPFFNNRKPSFINYLIKLPIFTT